MKPLRCVLWGCDEAYEYPGCKRCGADIHEDFVWRGRLWRLQAACRFLANLPKFFRWPRCWECGKRLPWKDRKAEFCSDDCAERFIPF